MASLDRARAEPAPSGLDLGARYSRHVLRLVNEYRAQHGLSALEVADSLREIADRHSRAMAARGRISHDGFQARFDRTQGSICVENVGSHFPHPEALLDGWRGSPAHHRNLLEPRITRVGVAASASYVTFFACG